MRTTRLVLLSVAACCSSCWLMEPTPNYDALYVALVQDYQTAYAQQVALRDHLVLELQRWQQANAQQQAVLGEQVLRSLRAYEAAYSGYSAAYAALPAGYTGVSRDDVIGSSAGALAASYGFTDF